MTFSLRFLQVGHVRYGGDVAGEQLLIPCSCAGQQGGSRATCLHGKWSSTACQYLNPKGC